MDEQRIDEFRQQLEDLRDELHAQNASLKDSGDIVELDQTRVGRLSRMDALQAQQMALEAGRRREAMLRKIEAALHRIQASEYGDCFACGEAIDERRLAFDPTSTRCIGCMED